VSEATFTPGTVVAGKYRVDKVLSSGGMGVILVGRHLQLDQRIAIKVLRDNAMKEPDIVRRFQREARAAAKIKSEHVARVIDVGELDGGVPYMVMEFLKGTDLANLVRAKGPLSVEETVDYVLQASEALAEAHRLGIVHRDLKPANLFLTRRADGSALVKVLDFGISKVVETIGDSESSDPLTKTQTMMGSPHYMSPEQLKNARHVDARADIWSLGCVLFKLLTAKNAFGGETTPELCVAILAGEPKPLRELAPHVPQGLEAVVMRCLVKDPAGRFADISTFARALEGWGSSHAKTSVERIVKTTESRPSLAPESDDDDALVDPTGQTEIDTHSNHPSPQLTTMRASVATTDSQRSLGPSNTSINRARFTPIVAIVVGAAMLLGAAALVAPRVMKGSEKHATASPPPAAAAPPPVETHLAVPAPEPAAPPPTGMPAPSASAAPKTPIRRNNAGFVPHPTAIATQTATVTAVAPAPPPPPPPDDFGGRK
jgi:serine/threonine protein kinase